MRVVIQRVMQASVTVEEVVCGKIDGGLLIFLGIEEADEAEDVAWLTSKIASLRIFNDNARVMNLSVRDVNGSVLVVSQFTLHALTKKGNRPSYIRAARPEKARVLYEQFISAMEGHGIETAAGQFGGDMKVSLVNDGPVTIVMDSRNKE